MRISPELVHTESLASVAKDGAEKKHSIEKENIQYTAIASLTELAALTGCPHIFISRDEGSGNSGFGEAGDDMAEMYLIWSPEETLRFSLNWKKLSPSSSIGYCLVDENMELSVGGDGSVTCSELSDPKALKIFLEELADVTRDEDDDFYDDDDDDQDEEDSEDDADSTPSPALSEETREMILDMAGRVAQKGH